MARSPDAGEQALHVPRQDCVALGAGQPGNSIDGVDRVGIAHLERVVGAEQDPVYPSQINQVADCVRLMQHRVEVEEAQSIGGRGAHVFGNDLGLGHPGTLHPPDLIRQETATVNDTHLEVGVALQDPGEEKTGNSNRALGGAADDVVQEVGREINPRQRIQGMQQQQTTLAGGLGPEWIELGSDQVEIAHHGADLDADHAKHFDGIAELFSS